MIQRLGPDSAFVKAVVGGPHRSEVDILADIYDVLSLANWQRGADPKHPPKKPAAYPRPGENVRKDRVREQAEKFRALTEGRQP